MTTYKGWTRRAPGFYTHENGDGQEAQIVRVEGSDHYTGTAWMLTYYGQTHPDDAFLTLRDAVEAFGPVSITRRTK